jgi:hypothetical protein
MDIASLLEAERKPKGWPPGKEKRPIDPRSLHLLDIFSCTTVFQTSPRHHTLF